MTLSQQDVERIAQTCEYLSPGQKPFAGLQDAVMSDNELQSIKSSADLTIIPEQNNPTKQNNIL